MTTLTLGQPSPNPVPEVIEYLTQKDRDPVTLLPIGSFHLVPYPTWPCTFPVVLSGFSGMGMIRIVRDSDGQSIGYSGVIFSDVSRNIKCNLSGPGSFSVHAEIGGVKSSSVTVVGQ